MPRISSNNLKKLYVNQQGIILTIRKLDPEIVGYQLKERVVELLPPEILFGDDVQTFAAIYPKIREFFNKNEATIPPYSSHCIIRQLGKGL